ncbi:hypothetical protein AJ80_03062 [Polytolypa hystricis UAMH7299]|uniref:Pentatricopeptide repeat domain-containing protein n=1 Tax=Polytolypa hystricis (strain UAMH7299) TaxID=1447883 RepID=A0A2B7YKN7_POLH7|nr:hypothetical protein AJ80_03062 [Polytolypa hystricis UAMH7299]
MRLALQRLLRRPSSIVLIDFLINSPAQLDAFRQSNACLRCQFHNQPDRRAAANAAADRQRPKTRQSPTARFQDASENDTPSPSPDVAQDIPSDLQQCPKSSVKPSAQSRTKTPKQDHTSQSVLSDYLPESEEPSRQLSLDFEALEFESDVGHTRDIGTKLIDNPEHARDFYMWKELLTHRQRHYGADGVKDIWKGFRERSKGVDLPVEGELADFVWRSFLEVALRDDKLLEDICGYADDLWARSRVRWPGLYETVVGGLLSGPRVLKKQAIPLHMKLCSTHLPEPNDVQRVFQYAYSSYMGLKMFRRILAKVEGHKIYSDIVPVLWRNKLFKEALHMHGYLVFKNDLPQSEEEVEPLITYAKKFGTEDQINRLVDFDTAGILKKEEGIDYPEPGTIDQEDSPDSSSSQGKPVKDEFGARLFATRTLTFDMILGGLKIFGAEAIGPLTLREMALRAENVEMITEQIRLLEEAGISIGNSVFSSLVRKLASSRELRLLHDLLHSDQHPDVLEDPNTQEALLSVYYSSEDWPQFNKTLTVLLELPIEDPYAYNILLRNALRQRHWMECNRILLQMREHDINITERTIRMMIQKILTRRPKGKRPILLDSHDEPFKMLRHLIGTLQHFVSSGGDVPPEAWHEALKRLGMMGLWNEFEKLCLWLATNYSPLQHRRPQTPRPSSQSKPATYLSMRQQLDAGNPLSPLRTIFSVQLQRAMISWGFILIPSHNLDVVSSYTNPFSTDPELLTPWVRGIILLRRLRGMGVNVHPNTLRATCRDRLAILFGDEVLSSRHMNRKLRKDNPWGLKHLVADIDKAWGKPLFTEWENNLPDLVNPKPLATSVKLRQQIQRPRHLWKGQKLYQSPYS